MKNYLPILISAVSLISNSYSMEANSYSMEANNNNNNKQNINLNTINSTEKTDSVHKSIKDYNKTDDFKEKYCTQLNDRICEAYVNLYYEKLGYINKNKPSYYYKFFKLLRDHFENISYYIGPSNFEKSDQVRRILKSGYLIHRNELKFFIKLFNSFDFADKFDKGINKKLDANEIDKYFGYKFVSLGTVLDFLYSNTRKLSYQTLLAIAQTIIDNNSDKYIMKHIQIILNKYQSILETIQKLIIKQFDQGSICQTNSESARLFKEYWRLGYNAIQQLDKFRYSTSRMKSRFDNLHNKLIQNLEHAMKKYTTQKINIQSKRVICQNKTKDEWDVLNDTNNLFKQKFSIKNQIPASNTSLILKSPSEMYVSEYIGQAILKIQEMKTFMDNIIKEREQINPYDLDYIMLYYFFNTYSLLLHLNIKELRQSIDFIKEFCIVYFDGALYWQYFLNPIKIFDSCKHETFLGEDYYFQYQLQYPQKNLQRKHLSK